MLIDRMAPSAVRVPLPGPQMSFGFPPAGYGYGSDPITRRNIFWRWRAENKYGVGTTIDRNDAIPNIVAA